MERKQAYRTGFTLIELLVVIAIIAILAAILFPVFAKARENARKASCLSNLKQIGMATMMYAQDYDEAYPYWGYVGSMTWPYGNLLAPLSGANTYDGGPWVACHLPYVKDSKVWFCATPSKDPPDHWKSPSTGVSPTNYQINSMVVLPEYWRALGKAPAGYGPVCMAQVANPSVTFVWEDWGQAYGNGAIHMLGTNFACLDGHAKWQKQGRKEIIGGWW